MSVNPYQAPAQPADDKPADPNVKSKQLSHASKNIGAICGILYVVWLMLEKAAVDFEFGGQGYALLRMGLIGIAVGNAVGIAVGIRAFIERRDGRRPKAGLIMNAVELLFFVGVALPAVLPNP